MRGERVRRGERIGLIVLIAVAAATHSATYALLAGLIDLRRAVGLVDRKRLPLRRARPRRRRAGARRGPGVCGRLCGGRAAGLDAGRLCALVRPHAAGRHRQEISRRSTAPMPSCGCARSRTASRRTPTTWFWGSDLFDQMGRFAGLGQEMETIALKSLIDYPSLQFESAVKRHRAPACRRPHRRRRAQFDLWHTYPPSSSFTRRGSRRRCARRASSTAEISLARP